MTGNTLTIRRRILAALRDGDATARDIITRIGVSRAGVHRALNVLHDAGHIAVANVTDRGSRTWRLTDAGAAAIDAAPMSMAARLRVLERRVEALEGTATASR